MNATPQELLAFLQSLDEELRLPALWLVRRSDLGAILDDYESDEKLLDTIEDRLFTQNRGLYEFIQERRKEN